MLAGAFVLMVTAPRDASATPGELTQLADTDGCVKEAPVAGDCADGRALDGARSVAVSPDGKHVYVASEGSGAVAVFSREK